MIFPVILSGGSGKRLWPMSQPQLPKQFLPLTSEHSVLQETTLRLLGAPEMAAPTFVCNQAHQFLIMQQLAEINARPNLVLVEPCPRNTAPAIASAALKIAETDPDALLLVLPSDHLITNLSAFYQTVHHATHAAQAGYLVTFGIQPDKPNLQYGYIQQGDPLEEGVFAVKQFTEKPTQEKADAYLQSGGYYWNSGMLLMQARAYLAELEAYQPAMLAACREAIHLANQDGDMFYLDDAAFQPCPSDSIDYAVMEKTRKAVVVPAGDMGWRDIGSWQSLWEMSQKDAHGNVTTQEQVYLHHAENCYINSSKQYVAILGASDLIVIDTENALLIVHKEMVDKVQNIISVLQTNESGRR